MDYSATAKKFDGKVFHVHCDTLPLDSELHLEMNQDNKQWGFFTPDIFLVISSGELMTHIQDQLRKHLTSTYKAESVTIQLGDSNGERGSQMISSNLASRVLSFVNVLRNRALAVLKEDGAEGGSVKENSVDVAPTQAGIRLYPKLPEVKGDSDATKAKIRELAIKYGALPETEDGEPRDVSNLDVTIKVNIFGAYNGKFYLNYRLVAPFRHKDKPEILAEQPKKSRKRAASQGPAGSGSAEGVAKKARAPAAKKEVDVTKYDNEDDLAMAYVKAGTPLRLAAKLAMDHFSKNGDEEGTDGDASMPIFNQLSRAGGSGGAGAGAAAADDEDA